MLENTGVSTPAGKQHPLGTSEPTEPSTPGDAVEPEEREIPEISYDEQRYPARPRRLRPRDQLRGGSLRRFTNDPRTANGTNPSYVEWLVRQSMLKDADVLSRTLSGKPSMWRNPYARPNARKAIETSDVWFTAYPISFITRLDESFLQALGSEALWDAFQKIGINGIHTGPVKQAGGITGWQHTPSVDGHFDRISTQIDPEFGDEEAFRHLCDVADSHGGSVIDDIVPGHTGKGADFRLAEMAYKDYPGAYHMVEIPPEDWHLLPDVPEGRDAVNLDAEREAVLSEHGYIIGELQRVIFYTPGVKETNWSVTPPVVGTDGLERRWVYLHYFKEGQPSINWLDPTFAGMRLVIGDALHSLGDLGTSALRLDANGFLGVEKSAEGLPAWSEGHPLSHAANHIIAGMVRKVGGFTFQELNLTMEDIRDTGAVGADLSYDFITRPGYHHALATGQTEFLRLAMTTALATGVEPVQLVHGLQNHDELTYELVHWATAHRDDVYPFRGGEVTGGELAETIRAELAQKLTVDADYNLIFTQNGIACTTASLIAATQGKASLADIVDDDVPGIRDAHLLLAKYNAWQPGVFALSGWDLTGTLTLPAEEVRALIASGDTRWIERGAHDLLDSSPEANFSRAGMPRARSLYGSLPAQLEQPGSFLLGLRDVIEVRREHGIAVATQVDIPRVAHPSMLVMVHRLDNGDATLADAQLQITALNFSEQPIEGTVHSEALVPGSLVRDAATGESIARVDDLNSFSLELDAYGGRFLLLEAPEPGDEPYPLTGVINVIR
ncbi:maltose alpha-D-glucosyltransferase [Microbacterium rhizomatis]|uniref:Maltose alpha-D-glucosyltransferase n=1 Tax=Microbacterium rhizomatis TaxID=1631477 RepID=A0A5J5IZ61_9MICO|nr:maltose alpha-D-glucosyltransferase [Microbacterium rhizomatis]KAA9106507.1 maltose alpha-D-glucosyltransferase [Microbacterium rhizomatis]